MYGYHVVVKVPVYGNVSAYAKVPVYPFRYEDVVVVAAASRDWLAVAERSAPGS